VSDAESRFYEAREEMRHSINCLPCWMGKPWLCKENEPDEETDE
jgi:hypothetical protein